MPFFELTGFVAAAAEVAEVSAAAFLNFALVKRLLVTVFGLTAFFAAAVAAASFLYFIL